MQPTSRNEYGLASLDFLNDFLADTEQLREQALAKLPASGEKPAVRERYEGADGTGAVVVAVDAKGMVTDADVKADWRQAVSADGFAAAVFQAYSTAVAAMLEDVALGELWEDEQQRVRRRQREDEERRAAQRGEQLPPLPEDEPERPDTPPEDPRDWMAWVQDSLYAIGDEMYRIERLERDAANQQDKVVWGSRGYLKVVHRGQDILSISGDATRISMAEPYQLRAEALEALRSAQHDND